MSDITWGSPVDKEYDVVPFEIGGNGGGGINIIPITYNNDTEEYSSTMSFSDMLSLVADTSKPCVIGLIRWDMFNAIPIVDNYNDTITGFIFTGFESGTGYINLTYLKVIITENGIDVIIDTIGVSTPV